MNWNAVVSQVNRGKYGSVVKSERQRTLSCFQGMFQLRLLDPHTLALWIIVPCQELMNVMNCTHLISLPLVWCRKALTVWRYVKVAGHAEGRSLPGHGRWFIALRQFGKRRVAAPCPESFIREVRTEAEPNTSRWWASTRWRRISHTVLWAVTHVV